MTESPAERYAAAMRRARQERSELAAFRQTFPFELDPFQVEACEAVEDGQGVLVAAPTGSGKTVVGQFGVHLALARGRRVMYTTPIKALSNQKFAELKERHGEANVGLLTGDVSINPDAPAIVMTTEVLRNMLYNESSALHDLDVVIMDEVHYLADRFRGPVWEEVIIHLPDRVQIISLSATVSNAEEFGAWLTEVRGPTAVVVWEHRPVPLWQHVMVGRTIYDLYAATGGENVINPQLLGASRRMVSGRKGRPPSRRVDRARVVESLDRDGLLPAIVFIFSRAGCDAAVEQILASGLKLTTDAEAAEIRRIVEHRTRALAHEDLGALGFFSWARALEAGVASHHAGLIPLFKEVVEELFTIGLLRVVYATETLALGINMPARSVVLERLVKWNGSAHVPLTPGEYTQLTGRAGRRGIDIEGHAVVLHGPEVDVEAVAGLAGKRTYPLNSAFHATYNMAANLLATMGRGEAREILQTSFAQFQADRGVVGLARQVRNAERRIAQHEGAITCERGDYLSYARIRQELAAAEKKARSGRAAARRAETQRTLGQVRAGDIIEYTQGNRRRLAVVHSVTDSPRIGVLLDVVTPDGRNRRLDADDVSGGMTVAGSLRIGSRTNPRTPRGRSDLAARLRSFDAGQAKEKPRRGEGPPPDVEAQREIERLRAEMRAHPCHSCPEVEEHARVAREYLRAAAERDALMERIEGRTGTIAAGFDRIAGYLTDLGYLSEDDQLTDAGALLRRVYSERDLLVAECLRKGIWDSLDSAELAAVVALVVYESRGDAPRRGAAVSSASLRRAVARTESIADRLAAGERERGIEPMPELDAGLVAAMFTWASGGRLADVVFDEEILPGDFVRWCRQVLDMCDQIGQNPAADRALAATARAARAAISRGIVTLAGV